MKKIVMLMLISMLFILTSCQMIGEDVADDGDNNDTDNPAEKVDLSDFNKVLENVVLKAYMDTYILPIKSNAKIEDGTILNYYGIYTNCIVVQVAGWGMGYQNALKKDIIEGIEFIYHNNNSIIVYHVGKFYSLAEAYEMGLLVMDDLLKIYEKYKEFYPTYNNFYTYPKLYAIVPAYPVHKKEVVKIIDSKEDLMYASYFMYSPSPVIPVHNYFLNYYERLNLLFKKNDIGFLFNPDYDNTDKSLLFAYESLFKQPNDLHDWFDDNILLYLTVTTDSSEFNGNVYYYENDDKGLTVVINGFNNYDPSVSTETKETIHVFMPIARAHKYNLSYMIDGKPSEVVVYLDNLG